MYAVSPLQSDTAHLLSVGMSRREKNFRDRHIHKTLLHIRSDGPTDGQSIAHHSGCTAHGGLR